MYNIYYYEPRVNILHYRNMTPTTSFHLPKAVSRTWTKQNVFHEIGNKIKYWCWCKCQQNMPTEQCQFEKEIFHWRKILWHNSSIIKVQCCININKILPSV